MDGGFGGMLSIRLAGGAEHARAVLREVPEEYPDRNREVNRFLPPLASAIHAIMKEQEAEIPYHSRVEHIATGGVAKYPDIVQTSLDELAAEYGVPVLDAREWMTEDDFSDSHHLTCAGATRFTERLAVEELAPWLRGLRAGRGGPVAAR